LQVLSLLSRSIIVLIVLKFWRSNDSIAKDIGRENMLISIYLIPSRANPGGKTAEGNGEDIVRNPG